MDSWSIFSKTSLIAQHHLRFLKYDNVALPQTFKSDGSGFVQFEQLRRRSILGRR